MATVVDLVSVDFIMCHVHRGGLKEWPLRQWLTRPSQNEKGGPFVERIFNEVIFILFLKELLSIAHVHKSTNNKNKFKSLYKHKTA